MVTARDAMELKDIIMMNFKVKNENARPKRMLLGVRLEAMISMSVKS